ncbi:hypothetical protein BD408DRAFT_483927 [Parasitella parasitica]|nr:hypothetical protein BD408DRAFT_483927 [Parasitella parasitica]
MGLLNLGGLYKKKSKKTETVPTPVTQVEPIVLKLDLDLNSSPSIPDINTIATTTLPQQQRNVSNSNAPAGSGSLFDDIFAELTTTSIAQVDQQDSMQNDISLAIALSQQLQLEEDNSTTVVTNTPKKKGGDSIYSNYSKKSSALDGNNGQPNSAFSTSMFDNLLGSSSRDISTSSISAANTNNTKFRSTTLTVTTNVVLDSDISDPDEDDSQNESQDGDRHLQNADRNQRVTKAVRPIMERKSQHDRLLVQHKADNWAIRVDPEANRVESNESVIHRMKDRHRNQVRLAALRQQQQDQQQYDMMPRHMVTQPYGPLPPNVVLPHPGIEKTDKHTTPPQRQLSARPFPTQSCSTPATSGRPRLNLSPPAMPLSATVVPHSANTSSNTSGNINTQTLEPSPASSSVTLQSAPSSLPTDVDDDNIDDKSAIVESPIQENFQLSMEEDAVGAEADAESSDDEERKSVIIRKKKSTKKLLQKQHQHGTDSPSCSSDTNSMRSHQIRSSRSAPNLKKKHSSKKVSKSTSRSSSSRNSQEACTPPSELIATPPPLPSKHQEQLHYHLPRSHSHQQQQYHHLQDRHRHSQPLRHMKSASDFPRGQHLSVQQQQLNNEWERMQYYHGHSVPLILPNNQQQQQPMPYTMPMYSSPLYYSTIPRPIMPYTTNITMEAYNPQQDNALRASMVGGNGNMMVYQSPPPQGYQHYSFQ